MTKNPPKGWRVEMLGLINAVEFTNKRHRLTWCDGAWTMSAYNGERWNTTPAHGVEFAANAREARTIGSEFLAAMEMA